MKLQNVKGLLKDIEKMNLQFDPDADANHLTVAVFRKIW